MKRALALTAALLFVAGCTGTSERKAPEPFGTRAVTAVLKDALILSAVKATLVADDPDSTTTLGVAVTDGTVTLRGTVRDAAARTRVVAAARKTAGVTGVIDRLRIDPRGPRIREQAGDVALAARVEAAITAQVGFQRVGVRVERGVATLTGTVPDAKTNATIVTTARGTAGVRNVVDRIRVGAP